MIDLVYFQVISRFLIPTRFWCFTFREDEIKSASKSFLSFFDGFIVSNSF